MVGPLESTGAAAELVMGERVTRTAAVPTTARSSRSSPATTRDNRRRGASAIGLHRWALDLRERRGHNKATIAVANKLGRIVWAVWTKDVPYQRAEAA